MTCTVFSHYWHFGCPDVNYPRLIFWLIFRRIHENGSIRALGAAFDPRIDPAIFRRICWPFAPWPLSCRVFLHYTGASAQVLIFPFLLSFPFPLFLLFPFAALLSFACCPADSSFSVVRLYFLLSLLILLFSLVVNRVFLSAVRGPQIAQFIFFYAVRVKNIFQKINLI